VRIGQDRDEFQMEHCVRSIPCERAEVTLMNKQASYHTAPGAYAQTEREFYTKI